MGAQTNGKNESQSSLCLHPSFARSMEKAFLALVGGSCISEARKFLSDYPNMDVRKLNEAFSVACLNHDADMLTFLLSDPRLDPNAWNSVEVAVTVGIPSALQVLLLDPRVRRTFRVEPFFWAIVGGHLGVLEVLVACDVDVCAILRRRRHCGDELSSSFSSNAEKVAWEHGHDAVADLLFRLQLNPEQTKAQIQEQLRTRGFTPQPSLEQARIRATVRRGIPEQLRRRGPTPRQAPVLVLGHPDHFNGLLHENSLGKTGDTNSPTNLPFFF